MEWTENPSIAARILQGLGDELEEGGRAKPLPHLMELVQCLTKSYNNRNQSLPLTPKEIGFFTAGRAVEAFILQKAKQHSVRGEFEGVNYEVDFLHLDGRVGELKSTRISTKKDPKDFPDTWTKQILGYMKCRGETKGVVVIFHIIPVELRSWEVEASELDINENWTWIQRRKHTYQEFMDKAETPEPFLYNEAWECKDCRYKLVCDITVSLDRQKDAKVKG